MTIQELEKQLKETRDALKQMETRVRVTEDIQEIQHLQVRYVNALMCIQWDDAADCFADNAKIDVYLHKPVTGKPAIKKWFKEELSKTHAGKEGDVCIHPIISVNGDRAKGKWLLYMMYFYPRTGQSLFWVQGFYNMEYIRERGKWEISLMNWTERLGLPGGGPPTGLW
jgi:hypothetical protein